MRLTGISRDSARGSSTIAKVKSLFKLASRKLIARFDFAAELRNSWNKLAGRQCSSAPAPFVLICRRYPCNRSIGVPFKYRYVDASLLPTLRKTQATCAGSDNHYL